MPKLLRSSETAGCGATIELDDGDIVYVSIARAGVMVRKLDTHRGLVRSLLSNFFGAKLYDEGSVYKNAQTAQALSLIYPEQASPLCFKNSVLAAFSNAIWHCSSAAEVCAVLNEAAANSILVAVETDGDTYFKLGNKYVSGREVTQDYAEAAKCYQTAAEQGHARAQSQLGLMFATGLGVTQDFTEAVRWCRLAAESGVAEAQSQLGDMYIKGQGVPQDGVEAAKWCRKAAEQGNATAQMLLGSMYHNGQGMTKDYVQAYKWLTLAVSQISTAKTEGDSKAVKIRDFVATKMTPDQIAKAQRLAQEWRVS